MLGGELYDASDPELVAARGRARELLAALNELAAKSEQVGSVASDLFGRFGIGSVVRPTFRCDYGFNIEIGERTFINFDCVFLDCNRISIGNEVQIAPSVHLYAATHPLNAELRRSGLELALPITLCDGVWLGGGVVVCPGVTIGENTVIGVGSVVTKDVPPNVVAVGNPCRVLRALP